ncbi:unnamed protein product [Closterium sp. NIES-53]
MYVFPLFPCPHPSPFIACFSPLLSSPLLSSPLLSFPRLLSSPLLASPLPSAALLSSPLLSSPRLSSPRLSSTPASPPLLSSLLCSPSLLLSLAPSPVRSYIFIPALVFYLMNRPRALSLYRNLLREIGKRPGGMSWAAAESRRRDVRMLFEMGRSEASVNNLRELFRTGEHVLAQLRRGHLPQVAYV